MLEIDETRRIDYDDLNTNLFVILKSYLRSFEYFGTNKKLLSQDCYQIKVHKVLIIL